MFIRLGVMVAFTRLIFLLSHYLHGITITATITTTIVLLFLYFRLTIGFYS